MNRTRLIFISTIVACLWFASLSVSPLAGIMSTSPRLVFADNQSSTRLLYLPLVFGNYQTPSSLWRFGVARARRPITDYSPGDLVSMRLGWYVDWGAGSAALSAYGMEYAPMVRVKQLKLNGTTPTSVPCSGCPYVTPPAYALTNITPSEIQSLAAARPGMLWIVGNEIERRDWGTCGSCGQDEIVPELYATAYHDVYSILKNADSTAQVAIGGLIQATPLRLKYLQRVWDAYSAQYGQAMPVDVWNVHAFVLNEQSGGWGAGIPAGLTDTSGILITPEQNKDFSIAKGHLVALRTWMKDHGQRSKPLIITEYGVNIPPEWCYPDGACPFAPDQVRDSFMYPSFDYFRTAIDPTLGFPADGGRLVQRWNWYSLDDDTIDPSTHDQAFNGNLFWSGLALHSQGVAPLGIYWKQYVQSLPPSPVKPY